MSRASPANQAASPSVTTKNSREKPVKTVSGSFLWSQRTFAVTVVKLSLVNDKTWCLADWLPRNRCRAPNLDAAVDPNSMAAAILRCQSIFLRLGWFGDSDCFQHEDLRNFVLRPRLLLITPVPGFVAVEFTKKLFFVFSSSCSTSDYTE